MIQPDSFCQQHVTHINQCLTTLFDDLTQPPAKELLDAMAYSTLSGGKRIRALLIYATGHLLNIDRCKLDQLAMAIECIHAFSLIHDDLPAMDNDVLRRGKPTCHVAFDEATAILAGDALQTLAFEIISNPKCHLLTAEQKIKMLHTLAHASGWLGMAGGQYLDISQQAYDIDSLQTLHRLKTGMLIEASVKLAYQASDDTTDAQQQVLDQYGLHIGIAFQIQDDILDITQSSDILGKSAQKDVHDGKVTYVSELGLTGAKQALDHHYQQALTALTAFPDQTDLLEWLASHIVQRHC